MYPRGKAIIDVLLFQTVLLRGAVDAREEPETNLLVGSGSSFCLKRPVAFETVSTTIVDDFIHEVGAKGQSRIRLREPEPTYKGSAPQDHGF